MPRYTIDQFIAATGQKEEARGKFELGRGSGETFQLRFQGSGWVVLQPYEEVYLQTPRR